MFEGSAAGGGSLVQQFDRAGVVGNGAREVAVVDVEIFPVAQGFETYEDGLDIAGQDFVAVFFRPRESAAQTRFLGAGEHEVDFGVLEAYAALFQALEDGDGSQHAREVVVGARHDDFEIAEEEEQGVERNEHRGDDERPPSEVAFHEIGNAQGDGDEHAHHAEDYGDYHESGLDFHQRPFVGGVAMPGENYSPLGFARALVLGVDIARSGLGKQRVDERFVEQELHYRDEQGDGREHDGDDVAGERRSVDEKGDELKRRGDEQQYGHDFGEADESVTGDGEILDFGFVRPTVVEQLFFQPFLRLSFVGHTRFAGTDFLADILDCAETVVDGVLSHLLRYAHNYPSCRPLRAAF